jgi:glutaredoxin-related protein
MARPILEESAIHPDVRPVVAQHHADIIGEVQQAIARHPVVVVGMGWNPFVKKAHRALDAAGIAHHDLDYGNYLSQWRRRNALKMWCGWATLPMVFVKGQLIGGANDAVRLINSGEFKRLLGAA